MVKSVLVYFWILTNRDALSQKASPLTVIDNLKCKFSSDFTKSIRRRKTEALLQNNPYRSIHLISNFKKLSRRLAVQNLS